MQKRVNAGMFWSGILLTGVVCFATACKSTTYLHTKADGSTVKVTDRRLLLNTAAKVDLSVDTNGIAHVTIDAQSNPAADAIKAAAEGAAVGVSKALGRP